MDYCQTKGRIFNIQRYCIHDGEGIRTIVFFKGCYLRCRWCCNPESQNYDVEFMKMRGGNTLETVGRDVTVAEVMAIVEKDRPYYRRSDGGLTLSGGEALRQPDFARDLLRAAKEAGFQTAMESTALADFEVIMTILPFLDVYLLDIKHMDPVKHEQFTGRRNDRILENAAGIAASGMTRVIIRVPVIPGFNATTEDIKAIAEFAVTLRGVDEMHLLPYHRFGEGKYAALGRTYEMEGVESPSAELMETLKAAVSSTGLPKCRIGG